MRKRLSLLLAIFLLIRLSFTAVAADDSHDHGGSAESTYEREQEIPIYVEQVDYISRYAVDVEYQSMMIQVESAIWDVNNYYYHVTMEEKIETQAVFSTELTVFNHSDQPIEAAVNVELDDGLALTDLSITDTKTLNGVKNGAVDPVDTSFPLFITATNGWTDYINSLIGRGVPDNNLSIVGSVTLTVAPVKSN